MQLVHYKIYFHVCLAISAGFKICNFPCTDLRGGLGVMITSFLIKINVRGGFHSISIDLCTLPYNYSVARLSFGDSQSFSSSISINAYTS